MPQIYTGKWAHGHWAITTVEIAQNLPVSIPPEEKRYLEKIRHPGRWQESYAVRKLAQLLDKAPYRSFSHSRGWVAVAVGDKPVAIDIENKGRPLPQGLERYFLSLPEQWALQTQKWTIWHFWCAKEVAYKLFCYQKKPLSFCKDLHYQGDHLLFCLDKVIPLHFWHTPAWIFALGYLH
ncbi:MAG: 4'-phosphopantetheinyl transferase family protein [Bacteroidia bacterium]